MSQFLILNIIFYKIINLTCLCCVIQCHNAPTHKLSFCFFVCLFFQPVLYLNLVVLFSWGGGEGHEVTGTVSVRLQRYERVAPPLLEASWLCCWTGNWWKGVESWYCSVQHTSFPAAPAGRMFSWVSWAECSLALRRSAAILEARRSAEVEVEEGDGSGRTGPAWEGFSTLGVGWRRSAAAVEALVRGPMLEKSLQGGGRN